jgi:Kef-type K+ transport system membrane component KefB
MKIQKEIRKNFLFYTAIMVGFFAISWWILKLGEGLESGHKVAPEILNSNESNHFQLFIVEVKHLMKHSTALMLLQIMVIVIFARIFGYLLKKIGQPAVIGEIIAGIILGPSLMGWAMPEFAQFVFPADSLGSLKVLSQLGLILFMFIVGMELDMNVLRNRAHAAIVISHSSIVFPYFLGILISYFLYAEFAPAGVEFLPFALFMGIAMSITAFPVLARIVQERNLSKKPIGSMVITCAAADDVTAWSILAAVIAIAKAGSLFNSLYTIAFALSFVLLMLFGVRPILKKVGEIYMTQENLTRPMVALILLVLIVSAYVCEIIGIHALFGAFLAGTVMPQNFSFKKILTEKIEDVSMILLLPLFFVFTGLRTQIGLLNSSHLWTICLVVIAVAVAGKFLGSAFAARFTGQSWKDSLIIGALMNTRGLMELVVLNIGYDLGVLNDEMFTVMVLMALITTFMTGPALTFIEFLFKENSESVSKSLSSQFRILISFGPGRTGAKLLKVASAFIDKNSENAQILAMHITPNADISPAEALEYEKESFAPVKFAASELGIKIETRYKATAEIAKTIVSTATQEKVDLLMLGAAKSVFDENSTGGLVRNVLDTIQSSAVVLIEKNIEKCKEFVFIPSSAQDDSDLHRFLKRLSSNSPSTIVSYSDLINSGKGGNFTNKFIVVTLSFWKSMNIDFQNQILLNNTIMIYQASKS